MIEYAFSYDPESNPKAILELMYTPAKEKPVYIRENGRWTEVSDDNQNTYVLEFPLLLIHASEADDAVKYWDEATKSKNVITETDIIQFLSSESGSSFSVELPGDFTVIKNNNSSIAPYLVASALSDNVHLFRELPTFLRETNDVEHFYFAEISGENDEGVPLISAVYCAEESDEGTCLKKYFTFPYDKDSLPVDMAVEELDSEGIYVIITDFEAESLCRKHEHYTEPVPMTAIDENYLEHMSEALEMLDYLDEEDSISASGYSSAQRSQDARSQVRSSGGRFIPSSTSNTRTGQYRRGRRYGSREESVGSGAHEAAQVIRARLPEGLNLVNNPLKYIHEKLKKSKAVAMIASAELIDDNRVQPEESPEVLYLAVVSPQDHRECYAIIAVGRTADGDFIVFNRVNGEWSESDEQKAYIQSPTPPKYIDLTNDEPTLLKALADLDESDNSISTPEEPETPNQSDEVKSEASLYSIFSILSTSDFAGSDYVPITGYKTNRDGRYTSDERSRKSKHQSRSEKGTFVGDGKTRILIRKGNSSTLRVTLSSNHKVAKVDNPVAYIREWLNAKDSYSVNVRKTRDFISYFVPKAIEAKNDYIFYGGFCDEKNENKLYDVLAFTKESEKTIKVWLRKDGMWRFSQRYTNAFEKDSLGDNFVHLKSRATVIDAVAQIDENDSQKYKKPVTASGYELFDEFGRIKGRAGGNTHKLMNYWAYGKGALRIRWGTPGDLTRAHRLLSKYVGPHRAWGLAQNLHKRVFGMSNNKKDKLSGH